MSSHGYISASLINTILDVAQKHGVTRSVSLDQLQLSNEQLNQDDFRLPTVALIELFEFIIQESQLPEFGLIVGQNIKPGSLNSLGYALMSAKNLYEALNIQKAFGGMISDAAELTISFKGELIEVGFTVEDADSEVYRPLHDMFISTFWNYANWITRTEGKLKVLNFTHARPSYIKVYSDIFGLEPHFEQTACSFVFDKKYLNDPLYQADAVLNGIMRERSQELLDKSKSNVSLYAAVASQVRKLMPKQKATLTLVAEGLNMSERSLSRKLKEEGYCFKSVLVSVRESLAFEYLKDADQSVTDIANKLGYRDYSAFSHAFRSWTGFSPSEFRESQESSK